MEVVVTYLRACLALLVASLAFVCGIVAASFLCGLRSPDAKSVVAVLGRLLCGLSFVVMFLKRPIFLLLQAALILACVGFCQACEWAATNGHLVRKDGVKDGRWKEPFAALNAAVLLFNGTRLLIPARYKRALVLARELGIPADKIRRHFGKPEAFQDEEGGYKTDGT
jgi:hypothetical protein